MYKIICDTACDWSIEDAKKHDVDLVSLYITFDGISSLKEHVEINREDFYKEMIENKSFPKTSMPSVADFYDAFLPYAKKNIDVLALTISSSLSGTFNSANLAKNMILEEYPNANILIVDTKQDSASEGLMLYEAIRMRNDKVDILDAFDVLCEMSSFGGDIFIMDTLEYLQKGGRINRFAAAIGNKMGLHTLVNFKNGHIKLGGLSRTRKKAKEKIAHSLEKIFKDIDVNDYLFTIESGYNTEECNEFREYAKKELNISLLEDEISYNPMISAVTACHTGPFALGVGYIPKYEVALANIKKRKVA